MVVRAERASKQARAHVCVCSLRIISVAAIKSQRRRCRVLPIIYSTSFWLFQGHSSLPLSAGACTTEKAFTCSAQFVFHSVTNAQVMHTIRIWHLSYPASATTTTTTTTTHPVSFKFQFRNRTFVAPGEMAVYLFCQIVVLIAFLLRRGKR